MTGLDSAIDTIFCVTGILQNVRLLASAPHITFVDASVGMPESRARSTIRQPSFPTGEIAVGPRRRNGRSKLHMWCAPLKGRGQSLSQAPDWIWRCVFEGLRKSSNMRRAKSPAAAPLSVRHTQGAGSLISGRWQHEG